MTTTTGPKPKEILVVYHTGCMDGLVAAWTCWRRWGPHAEYAPMSYERSSEVTPESVEGRTVLVLDFSFEPSHTLKLCGSARKLVWLDHHKSAIEAWEETQSAAAPNMEAVLNQGMSGCRLAWRWHHGADPSPWLVEYAEDRDLWRWKLPQSRQVNAALRSMVDLDPGKWQEGMLRLDYLQASVRQASDLARDGAAILMAEEQIVKRQAAEALVEDFDDQHAVPTVNCAALISETLELLLRLHPAAPMAAGYYDGKDGRRHWSLRSRVGGIDVSAVAKKFGGGGHPQAAGFVADVS